MNTPRPSHENIRRTLLLQFLIGACIHLTFAAIVLNTDSACTAVKTSTTQQTWIAPDTISYVNPAEKYLSEFDRHGLLGPPNRYRTMGYPALIALTMKISPTHWITLLIYFQAVVSALIYPALSIISRTLFASTTRQLNALFIFMLFVGAYVSRVAYVLTDLIFVVSFYAGLASAMLMIIRRSWLWLIPQVLLIGYASLVRPTLYFFPVLHLAILTALAVRHCRTHKTPALKYAALILCSIIPITAIAAIPTIKNYKHYNTAVPSHVLGINAFNITGKYVLTQQNRQDLYQQYLAEIKAQPDPASEYHKRVESAVKIFKQYPLTTLRAMAGSSAKMLGITHWLPAFQHFNKSWWYLSSNARNKAENSTLVKYVSLFFAAVHLAVYAAFALFLLNLLTHKKLTFLLILLATLAYLIGPVFIAGGGARLRLPAEGIIIICALHYISHKLTSKTQPAHTAR
ncbi:hypothetical protein STSP2_03191 [Anaerohalosphaera lusitana]|uniref:Glycosyltransferase RgtA/B/C/D-like domain-containing protein n=1 Tax=Anaerohalosphaera lusitana TaxID=1936003 RepID=A0A1U9NQU7_9BACT|nr:hypothetical protein [Anaerohalosphaera lusitana]AQT69990.1 hypothetical protein STSP2_03191 [Anaerohalosphaera lusitana]